ncbi:transcriptional repressor NrdR [Candidatus Poribacteria bacterium]|nr:transcriptional repressor NrdR [Candidatus Poribacteria bacterium]
MRCPFCQHPHTRVTDKRDTQSGAVIRRRRECQRCQNRFTTFEQPVILDMMVIKKDGRREPFNREKLRMGVQRACWKRPASQEAIDALVARIEQGFISRPRREVSSRVVGELVMDALKTLDDIAYIRFASVYREFRDAEDFQEVLQQLGQVPPDS